MSYLVSESCSALQDPQVTGIKEQVAHDGIQWQFNPPSGSHHGGVSEAIIKSCKKLYVQSLGYPELRTTVVEVKGILNFRPLTNCSSNTDEEQVLRPVRGWGSYDERSFININAILWDG